MATDPSVRVEIRMSGTDGDRGELPFVVGLLGDFSGHCDVNDLADTDFLTVSPRQPAMLFRQIRPRLRFDIDHPTTQDRSMLTVRLAFRRLDDFSPERLCLADGVPLLQAATALRSALLSHLRAPGGQPSHADVVHRCHKLRRVVSDALTAVGHPLPPDGVDIDASADWATLTVAAGAWLSAGLTVRATWTGMDDGAIQGPKVEQLLSLDIVDEVTHTLMPALLAALEGNAIGNQLPWAAATTTDDNVFAGCLGCATGELKAAVCGETPFSADHAGWLAARLEALVEGILSGILRHEAFLRLEATWRALSYLMSSARGIVIKIFNVSKAALFEDFQARSGNVAKTRLYELVHDQAYNSHGGIPFTLLAALFDVGASGTDVEGMRALSEIGARSHCPVLLSAAHGLVGDIERWVANPRAATVDSQRWTNLRRIGNTAHDDGNARFLGVVAPQVLARARHCFRADRPSPIRFDEPPAADPEQLPWTGGAVPLVKGVLAAFQRYGWHVACSGLDGDHGLVIPPATDGFQGETGADTWRPPTRTVFTERRGAILERAGLSSPCRLAARHQEAFLTLPSLFLPDNLDQSGPMGMRATLQLMAARLPYTFAVTRFAHHIKAMQRERLGVSVSVRQLELEANAWLARYVAWQPDASARVRAEKPLRRGAIQYEAIPDRPGFYRLKIQLQPHYQVEHLDIDLELSSAMVVASGGG